MYIYVHYKWTQTDQPFDGVFLERDIRKKKKKYLLISYSFRIRTLELDGLSYTNTVYIEHVYERVIHFGSQGFWKIVFGIGRGVWLVFISLSSNRFWDDFTFNTMHIFGWVQKNLNPSNFFELSDMRLRLAPL